MESEDIVTPLPDGTYRHVITVRPTYNDYSRYMLEAILYGSAAAAAVIPTWECMADVKQQLRRIGLQRNRQRARQWAQRPRNVRRRRQRR